jgi:hypothetical protein
MTGVVHPKIEDANSNAERPRLMETSLFDIREARKLAKVERLYRM